jgi:serine/threonine protein kinase
MRLVDEETPGAVALARAAVRRIDGYDLIREIGRGGMGIVFEAWQQDLKRIVALKVIIAGEFASERSIARFKEEAETIARLDHPNIVPIYSIGEHQGHHYFTMKMIRGESLARSLERLRSASPAAAGAAMDHRAAAALVAKLARAIHFVHQQGLIHRDLSPENILLDERGEPFVTDFGLARFLQSDQPSRTYTVIGKPDYMSPEQAAHRSPEASPASDQFSLGVVLYEILTGARPFAAETPLATLEKLRTAEPLSPSSLNTQIPPDLETICLKTLAKDAKSRYDSVGALADDLDRWLRGETILARRVHSLDRAARWLRRHPLKTSLAAAVSLAIIAPIFVAYYFDYVIVPEAARAHPIVGRDQNVGGFQLTFETGHVDRATMNFDTLDFRDRSRPARLYFTNIPPASLSWISNLQCQIMADIPADDDPPRSPTVRSGQTFIIEQRQSRDRAYYVKPYNWQGREILARAPNARLVITLLDGE